MKIFITIVLGILYTLCFAPFHLFAAGFISFTGLLLILDSLNSPKKAFWYGFLFAFAHHVSGLYWISYSMLVEPEKFAWMIPFTVSVIPAYLSLYVGAVCWLTYKFNFKKINRILFFASMWTLAEMARSYLFTGFPWNLTGYVFLTKLTIAQTASYISVYGLSLIAIILFCSPHFAARYIKNSTRAPIYKYSLSLYYLIPIILLLVQLSNLGSRRIDINKSEFEKINIRIVQPNIPQKEKFDPLRIGDHLFKFYNLTLSDGKDADYVPDLIVWPEASVTTNLADDHEFMTEIADIIPYSAYLILGSVRQEGWMVNRKIFNSVQFVDSEGNLETNHYDKAHLVPFGEYVPLRKLLPFVNKLANGIGDFNKGDGPKTIKLANSPAFSPLICYEVIFPGMVVDKKNPNKPEWILNVTNDAWFGNSSGPYQHLDAARMRAIEEGLPVIRSANTGVSAVIDGMGRILNYIKLNEEGVIDTKLPKNIAEETYYSKNGNKVPLILAAGIAILSLLLKYVSKVLSKGQPELH